jgi:hypothetical protein
MGGGELGSASLGPPDLRLQRILDDRVGDVARIVGHHRDREPGDDLEHLVAGESSAREAPQVVLVDVPPGSEQETEEPGRRPVGLHDVPVATNTPPRLVFAAGARGSRPSGRPPSRSRTASDQESTS